MSILSAVLIILIFLLLTYIFIYPVKTEKKKKRKKRDVLYGYVYVLSNPSFRPGIFKVGMTGAHPKDRAKQLRSTGVPTHFETCIAIETEDYKKLEKDLHKLLADKRICRRREFFKLDLEDLAKIQCHIDVTHVDEDAIQAALEPL